MRRFFRLWLALLASLILVVPMVALIWSVGSLLDFYQVPTYVGALLLMVFSTAIPALLMTSTRLTRWIVRIMTWAER